MKVKEIKFEGGQFGCYKIKVGDTVVGEFAPATEKIEGKPYKIKTSFPGIVSEYPVKDQSHAREMVNQMVLLMVENLTEPEK